jgi:hypothetical protein
MELSESHDLGHGFDILTQVDLDYLFFFFSILFFNIELIENEAS